jgi:hypothetical protein
MVPTPTLSPTNPSQGWKWKKVLRMHTSNARMSRTLKGSIRNKKFPTDANKRGTKI